MDNVQIQNKETIRILYDTILNKGQFKKLADLISEKYTNVQGDKGVSAFQNAILELIKSFPDAQWKIEEIIADGNKVIVKQKFTGIQKNQFQNIAPTNNAVCVDGIVTYEFQGRKILSAQIQTDRLGFLQQLGVLPADITTYPQRESANAVYFIDKFAIPKMAIDEFVQKMTYNRNLIKTLPGYIRDQVFRQYDNEGNLTLLTIAVWENQDKLAEAKNTVQATYEQIGFNPVEFYQRLNIKMERGLYKSQKE